MLSATQSVSTDKQKFNSCLTASASNSPKEKKRLRLETHDMGI